MCWLPCRGMCKCGFECIYNHVTIYQIRAKTEGFLFILKELCIWWKVIKTSGSFTTKIRTKYLEQQGRIFWHTFQFGRSVVSNSLRPHGLQHASTCNLHLVLRTPGFHWYGSGSHPGQGPEMPHSPARKVTCRNTFPRHSDIPCRILFRPSSQYTATINSKYRFKIKKWNVPPTYLEVV